MASERISLLLGAVAYDPRVVTIWDGMASFFETKGIDLDYVLFSSYELQVEALLSGQIDIAWNAPLAHVNVRKRTNNRSLSLGMRDTDQDLRSCLIARRELTIGSLREVEGRKLAVGSRDSTQARILPLYFLKEDEGVDLDKVEIIPFDLHIGKHGDTGASEREVINALVTQKADFGTVSERTLLLDPNPNVEIIWCTPAYDHCMFDALPELDSDKAERFQIVLFQMDYDRHRNIMDMEDVREWMPPRESGYESLVKAVGASW